MTQNLKTLACFLLVATSGLPLADCSAKSPGLEIRPADHICYIGNTMADRMQHHAWLETYLHALYPNYQLTFRNLGFAGDELKTRPRSENFGSPDQWLFKCQADIIFCFFGYNEALRGEAGVASFQADLEALVDQMQSQQYNGKSPPRIVIFSPIAHENLRSPHLPDGTENNKKIARYRDVMEQVCTTKRVPFVDLFTPTQRLYRAAPTPLTLNGIHLLDHGNQAVAEVILQELFPAVSLADLQHLNQLRKAVQQKNDYWFNRYRVVDGYNVYGGRSKLAWHGQSNADVMRREMEIFDVLTANRDHNVWRVAQGKTPEIHDDNLPELLTVKTNKEGPLDDGSFPYLDAQQAIHKMKLAEGMEINLFASEAMFPRLINPVQMAVDTNSRLWASVWPSYPHWKPTEPRRDALLILPDEDGDGIADECIVFADQLNSVTGFEFWGGGVLVAAPPEIWFLKDTDGDDRADVKIRILQGISSADTHHTANAMLIGPDGWLYWSRGVFNVANFETPTRTYRSSQSGVHRFNPRTFEVEFHFPIGPNPHGDVFDRWGYQFANDGTSGTGSYVNIGRGIWNKQWFDRRVRPVSSTGILSSEHFPAENNNHFLICNTIGFLGVLQHRVNYNGADIKATEIEPLLVSSDPNFRPSDLEIGGDGALYVSDWHNVLIGHMQHNMRDPNRDHEHGRIYRITAKGRKLLEPARLKEKPVAEVCQHLLAPTNSVRYRARIEMSGRDTSEVVSTIEKFAAGLTPQNALPSQDEAQALLECLWVLEEHRQPNTTLLKKVYEAHEPRVRAAAIRTLGHWAGQIDGWQSILQSAARDASPLVRAEAVKAAACFPKYPASEVILEVASRPVDPELNTVIRYAANEIDIESILKETILSGTRLSPTARKYALQNMAVEDLLKLPLDQEICRTILNRENATAKELTLTLSELASLTNRNSLDLLLELLTDEQSQSSVHVFGLGELLTNYSSEELAAFNGQLQNMATNGATAEIKSLGYAAWIIADRSGDNAFLAASNNNQELRCFLESISKIPDDLKTSLYEKVRPLVFSSTPNLTDSQKDFSPASPGIHVDYFYPSLDNVKAETLDRLDPTASGFVHNLSLDIPRRTPTDNFSLRFSGELRITTPGKYRFSTVSDDGSRLYINGQLVVDNDGPHGMQKKTGSITLAVGKHPWSLNYFNQGKNEGLRVSWSGPGFGEQPIPPDRLMTDNNESLQEKAIRTLGIIPGQESQKIRDLVGVLKTGKHLSAAISELCSIPIDHWSANQVRPVIDNLISYLSEMPVRYRTNRPAQEAITLAKLLASILPPGDADEIDSRLKNLDVRVIAIGTVPHRMIFDKEKIVVQADSPVEFRFSNTDAMPHNFAILLPGALQQVGELAEATAREADAADRHYLPKSDKILLASHLLQPGQNQTLSFHAPTEPGIFPYVCTYPGHWRRMFGALYVVRDLSEYIANPALYLAENPLPVKDGLLTLNSRAREWTFDELEADVHELPRGRSFEVGQELFKVANCVACHSLNNQGCVFGPDLVALDPQKKTVAYILQSILDPSKDIEKKFQSYTFLLDSGKVITGMIVAENDQQVSVVIDPLAKDKPTVLERDEIEETIKSPVSLMPEGLLNKLSREEILDLVAYVYAGGNAKHKLFEGHDHAHHHH